jgi:hypothetical protein
VGVLVLASITTDQEVSVEERDEWRVAEDWGDECWSDEWRNREAEGSRVGGDQLRDGDVERTTRIIHCELKRVVDYRVQEYELDVRKKSRPLHRLVRRGRKKSQSRKRQH